MSTKSTQKYSNDLEDALIIIKSRPALSVHLSDREVSWSVAL